LCLLGAGAIAVAQDGPAQPDESVAVQTAAQALAMDAASYARDAGISEAEAARRLTLREQADEQLTAVRARFEGRYAGGYIDNGANYGLVIRLTGDAAVANETLTLPAGQFPVRYEVGAAATLATLVAAIQNKLGALKLALPTLQGVGTDERTGQIVATVHAIGVEATALKGREAELTALVGHPVRVETVAQPTRLTNIRGGTKLFNPANPADYCTGAFVAKNGTTPVLTTAGHCTNALKFLGNDNVTEYTLSYVTGSSVFDSNQDVQLHTSGTAMLPEFWADTNVRRVLTGRRYRTSTYANDEVCHRGMRTGYSCGLVTITNHAPTFSGACGGQTCEAVWVNVAGANLRCYPGDSGGPVFASQTAFGIQSSANYSSPDTGGCGYLTYMSTDFLPSGTTLQYGV
jgi:hypothetical protein